MSVANMREWRLPGCGPGCFPRSHDPLAHEAYGRLLERRAMVPRVVRTGPLTIDLNDPNRVVVDGRVVALTSREWRVLAYLAERVGRACSAEEIVSGVWGPEYVTTIRARLKRGQTVSPHRRLLNTTTNRLRRKLGPAATLLTCGGSWLHIWRRLERVEPTS